jgi:MFS family permease
VIKHDFDKILIFFSTYLFSSAGLPLAAAQLATLLGVGVNLVSTICTAFCVERLGRRYMLLGGDLCAVLSLVVFTLCVLLELSWGAVIAVLVFYVAFRWAQLFGVYVKHHVSSCGPGPIVWFVSAEVAPQNARSKICSSLKWCDENEGAHCFLAE